MRRELAELHLHNMNTDHAYYKWAAGILNDSEDDDMNADDPIELPDDPLAALGEIKGYLRSLNKTEHRAVRDPVITSDIWGYWQTPEWLDGLLDIANECERIIATHQPRGE